MEIKKGMYGEYEVVGGCDSYTETEQAQPTSRLLAGSRDADYGQEYIGYGVINNIPVIAVYLLDEDQEDEDEDDIDWEKALDNGRIIINVDKLDDAAYAILEATIK